MDISGLDKAVVLAALYNRARPQGMGFMHYDQTPMTVEEARGILDGGGESFDYLKGRVMKISLAVNEVDTRLYNRDNGGNAAEEAVAALRETGEVNPPDTQAGHRKSSLAAARQAKEALKQETTREGVEMKLGLADVADLLGPAVDRVIDSTRPTEDKEGKEGER